MPTRIDPNRFSAAYRSAAADVMRFMDRERQLLLARHDQSLHPDRHDLGAYLRFSEKRYAKVVELYNRHGAAGGGEITVLDVGGFLAAFPLALARIGIPATVAEEYDYYYGAFDDLRDYLENGSVRVWSADLTQPDVDLPEERFTLVTNMAMIEHLANSPKPLMRNLRSLVHPAGKLLLEVPNVSYWPNRLEAIRGLSIHQPLELVYESESPYLGHHREYTEAELRRLLDWAGFAVEEVAMFNYSLSVEGGLSNRLYMFLVYVWPMVFRRCRELLLACAAPAGQPRDPLVAAPPGRD